jgi:hypothetical protein
MVIEEANASVPSYSYPQLLSLRCYLFNPRTAGGIFTHMRVLAYCTCTRCSRLSSIEYLPCRAVLELVIAEFALALVTAGEAHRIVSSFQICFSLVFFVLPTYPQNY